MDATMRSLLRERLQTSFDGVTRSAECSRSVTNTQTLLRSRAGVLALICWLAAYSCSAPAPPPKISTSSRSQAQDTFQHVLDRATSPTRPATVPHKAAVLRSVHTSARPRTAQRLPITSLQQSASAGGLSSQLQSTAGRASLSSLPHPQPRNSNWFERLAYSLGFSLSASEHQTEHNSQQKDAATHPRQRLRGVGRLHSVMQDPEIYDPIVVPRHPIVLCHGLYGFDVRGPFFGLEIHYWAETLDILRKKMGVDVLVHGVPATGSIKERAESLHEFLMSDEAGVRGKKLNFIAHSMGGLDVRHLLAHIRPQPHEYQPVSLTTISTPHRGSPFMDWCNANIGIGNDYIEKAIEEARAERNHLSDREHRPTRATKVPYTLKTPLFTRPKPLEGSNSLPKKTAADRSNKAEETKEASSNNESTAEMLFSTAASAVSTLTSSNPNDTTGDLSNKVKEAVKKGSKKDGSLPFGLSSFISSLSTLTGSFSSYMLSMLDTPAYAMLSTKYMNEVFNPRTPNVDGVKYYSIASRTPSLAIWHPLWLPKLILDAAAESRTAGGEIDGSADALGSADQGNDGLVSVESAKWGEFLGVMEGCDHWDLRGGGAPRWRQKINPSTGRPYPTNNNKGGQEEAKQAPAENDKSSSSWIDINRLLFSKSKGEKDKDASEKPASAAVASEGHPITAFRSFKELAESEGWNGVSLRDPETADESDDAIASRTHEDGEDENDHPASFSPHHQDDTLIQEIAGWISDRLPSGNPERRALAERRDKLIEESSLYAAKPGGEAAAGLAGNFAVDTSARAPSAAQSAAFSTSQPASQATAAPTEAPTKSSRKDHSDLERFWIALCRHLHNEGH